MSFVETFGGMSISPSQLSYLSMAISADTELHWPVEQQVGGIQVVADIIDVTAGAPGLNVDMPDARLVSTGTNVLFNNLGSETITIRGASGATIISLTSGTSWFIYLVDNTTSGGTWRTFQFGASVSVANAAALAGAGLKAIATTLNTRVPVSVQAANYVILNSDRAVALVWTSGVGDFTLPSAGTVGSDWYTIVRNSGSGNLTVTPPSGTIDGSASATFAAGSSAFIVSDGVNYFTIGFGTGSGGGGGSFGYITINVPGSGDYTLAGAELNRVAYKFTGILTGNRNIVVPNSVAEYWVDNQTTGPHSLFVKTAAQVPGVEVTQGSRNILYCDGTNVVAAESATVSFPIAVSQGGTGAINATTARTNLGATAVGAGVFTAVSAASARTILGVAAGLPITDKSASYTCTIDDADSAIRHTAGAGAGDQFTIPSNAAVPYPVGTTLTFINVDTNSVAIFLNTDTMYFMGTTVSFFTGLGPGTGRALLQNGVLTAIKIDTTVWVINGQGAAT